jgi:phosphotransferase system  glucose/maltose/N-acetylglucosamine-specific IIC component
MQTMPSHPPVPRAVQLALLWAGVMFLYIYNDYFQLYMPGVIERMMDGRMGPLGPATDSVMIGVSLMLAIPALMVGLSALTPPVLARWANVVLGAV